jgi:hypothetical protein
MKSLIRRLLGYDLRDIALYTSHLVKAVNKLGQAAGIKVDLEECTAGDGAVYVTLEESINTIRRIAKVLDEQRLARVADDDEVRENYAHTTERLDALQHAVDEKSFEAERAALKRMALVEDFIKFRDQLSYFEKDYSESGDDTAARLLSNLYKETGRLMQKNGIEPLETDGVFDAGQQMVVGTKSTNRQELDKTPAGTLKSGYRIDGILYRAQEIELYVFHP